MCFLKLLSTIIIIYTYQRSRIFRWFFFCRYGIFLFIGVSQTHNCQTVLRRDNIKKIIQLIPSGGPETIQSRIMCRLQACSIHPYDITYKSYKISYIYPQPAMVYEMCYVIMHIIYYIMSYRGCTKYRLSKYYTTFINKGRVTCWARRCVPGGRCAFLVTRQIYAHIYLIS